MRVLLVDDDALNRAVICGMLELPGVEIDEAQDAPAGLRLIDRNDYDVVLLDLRMPGMDGSQALRAIRARDDRRRSLPVIIVTADTRPQLLQQCLSSGADDFLYKPINSDLLMSAIARIAMMKRSPSRILI